MSTKPIDYDALAKQYGATSSTAPAAVDYDALAKQNGAISSTSLTHDERSLLSKAWSVLTDPKKREEFVQQLQPTASDDAGTLGAKGAARAATTLITLPFDLLRPPTAEEEQTHSSALHTYLDRGKKMIVDPMQQTADQARKDMAAGGAANIAKGVVRAAGSGIPVVGPMAADLITRLPNDPIGVTTEAATYALAPKVKEAGETLVDGAKTVPVSPRGALAGRMAEVPPGELFSRGEVLQAARDHGVNLDLADATDSGVLHAAKKANTVSTFSKGTIEKNAAKNAAALNEWGEEVLQKAHDTDLNQQQTGDLVKKALQDKQAKLYDAASQYFTDIDNTIGTQKPDVTSIRQIARDIVKENSEYYNKHPELQPTKAWKTVQALAGGDGEAATADGMSWKEFYQAKMPAAMKAAGSRTAALKLVGQQWIDLGGQAGVDAAKPVTYTWSDLQKLRSDLMKEVQSVDIVGSRSEGWLKHLEGAISEAMDKSAGKFSPEQQELYQRANGIWQAMKGTYDNPQHPFYHIVRAMDGTTAGNAASRLKPEFVNQLRDAMGESFTAYQRDAIARILNPKNSANGFDFKNLNTRLSRADVERLSAVLSPEQIRELQLMGKIAGKVTADVNPSGTAKTGTPVAEGVGFLKAPAAGAVWYGGNWVSAKAITSPKVIDYLTKPAKTAAKSAK